MSDIIENFFNFKALILSKGFDVWKVTVSPEFIASFETSIMNKLKISMKPFFETFSGLDYEVDYTDNGISIKYDIMTPFMSEKSS